MDSENWGALGIWLVAIAAIVAGSWSKSRRDAEKHETLRRIVEKTGTIDEANLKALLSTPEPRPTKPGGGYRALRITGTIIMFVGAVPALFGIVVALFGGKFRAPPPPEFGIAAMVFGACIAVLGLGVFYSSRFAEPPPGIRNDPPAT